MALELSMAPATSTGAAAAQPTSSAGTDSTGGGSFLDPAFVSQLLGSVDVDQNDPLIQAALAQLQGPGAGAGNDGKGDKDKEGENRKRKGDDV